jgi:hypothetical protein
MLQPHGTSHLSNQLPSSNNHTPAMTLFLRKSKAAIMDLLKSLPAVHMAEEKDFEVWGHQFVAAVVSRIQLGGWIVLTKTLPRTLFTACLISWDAWRMTLR